MIQITLLVCCSGCKPDEGPTYYMDQEFKDYVVFGVGSYWVYEDQDLQIDSLYCHRSKLFIKEASENLGYDYERLQIAFKTSFYNDSLTGDAHPERNDRKFYVYEEGSLTYFLNSYIQFFNNQLLDVEYQLQEDSKLKYESYFDEFNVLGKNYQQVRVFTNLIPNSNYAPERIYYARNVGVIRKEMLNGQVWNLKRYHVNQ